MTPVDLPYVPILLNETLITALWDTGAEKSFISEEVYRKYFSYRPRQRTKNRVVTYQGALCCHSDKLGLTLVLYHEIDTGDQGSVVSRPCRYDRVNQGIIDDHIQKIIKKGIIRLIQSPYASPVVLTRKNNGLSPDSPEAYRFAIDYCKLNAITKYPRYPLPLIDDLITNIPFTTLMSILDLRFGYFQLTINPREMEKTAFITKRAPLRSTANPVDNVDESQISCAALRALALNSREQREDPELGHNYRYLENPDDVSVNATEPLQRNRRTAGGAEEYGDRQPTTEQPQEKESQYGSIRRKSDR
ncbi:retrovirus-related Pol polyprotein from transposon 17.6 [Trichonephila clavipes]|nr:retrovirus-related Pol polyprotein from transposon 17.6 [Trichonephila clavipes]